MEMYNEITSKDNKYLQTAAKLGSSAKERGEKGMFVIEGLRICEDAFENGVCFDVVFVSRSFFEKSRDTAMRFFAASRLNFVVKDVLFSKISDTKTPQGILIIAKIPPLKNEISKGRKYIALDNLQDPVNLGAVARTAEALGISGIILGNSCCDPYSPKSLRASMGTLLRMPLILTDDLAGFLKEKGLNGVSFVVDAGAESLTGFAFSDDDVIIIGNEANGIGDSVKSESRALVRIPMKGSAESLNAAAAAAIAIYEFTK